jgi:hypothetical protein
MLSRGRKIWLLSHPLPPRVPNPSRQKARLATDRKTKKGRQAAGGMGGGSREWARSRIIRPQVSLVPYKSFNALRTEQSLNSYNFNNHRSRVQCTLTTNSYPIISHAKYQKDNNKKVSKNYGNIWNVNCYVEGGRMRRMIAQLAACLSDRNT